MKIEKMAQNKVKVTVPKAEMQEMGIEPDNIRPDAKELHALMFFVMQTVKNETDFNPFSGQVAMEAFPNDEGMCVIISKEEDGKSYINKSVKDSIIEDNFMGDEVKKRKRSNPVKRELLKCVKSVTPRIKEYPEAAFVFYEFDNMCAAFKEAADELINESELYKLEDLYILWVPGKYNKRQYRHTLVEYSVKDVIKNCSHEYLEEHAQCLAKGEKLLNMAQGIRNL